MCKHSGQCFGPYYTLPTKDEEIVICNLPDSPITFADATTLFFLLLSNLNRFYINQILDSDIWCKLAAAIAGNASSSSVWLTIAVTAERFVAVCYPLKASTLCTRKTDGITSTFIIMSALLYNLQHFWFM